MELISQPIIVGMQSFLRSNKFLSLASNGSSAILGLIRFGLTARLLDTKEFGIWAFFIMFYSLFDMLRTGLLSNVVVKKWSETENAEEHKSIKGATWQLAGGLSIGLSILSIIALVVLKKMGAGEAYLLTALYFAPSLMLSLPQTVSTWLLNAQMKFDSLLGLRLALQIPAILLTMGLYWVYPIMKWYGYAPLHAIFWIHLLSTAMVSLICLLMGWGGISFLRKGTAKLRKELVDFGRYSMGTSISTHLLKSSDTFLLMPFRGPIAVALYNIPERLLQILEIPVRSVVQATFPKLARVFHRNPNDFNKILHGETFILTLGMLPIVIGVLLFADTLVIWLGGDKYVDSANVLRVFAIYTALVPMDRYSGIAMDAMGKPELNFRKVIIMLLTNLVGDIVVLQLGYGVLAVSLVSVLTFSMGVFYGYYLLIKTTGIPLKAVISMGKEGLISRIRTISGS